MVFDLIDVTHPMPDLTYVCDGLYWFCTLSWILRCAKFLGEKHQHLASSLVPELLSTHPFFATPEPSIDDPAYVTILILVFNATAKSSTMLAMFPDHTNRHYAYLRDSQPDLVPHLDIEKGVLELDHKKTEEEGKERMESERV